MMRRRRFEPIVILGVVLTALLHGGAITGILLYRLAHSLAAVEPQDGSYVVAKLVRLGKPRDKRLLPQKQVHQKATSTPQGADYTADENDPPSKKPKPNDREPDESDRRRRALGRADVLAEGQSEIDQEGSPFGSPHGTAATDEEGDPYLTRIADLWDRNWDLPAVIPRSEASKLYVKLTLRIDKDGNIELPIVLDRESGNPHFDSSIKAAWTRIKTLPLPPPDRLAAMLANGLRLKLTYKGIQ